MRRITNQDHPLVAPDGTPHANAVGVITLVGAGGERIDALSAGADVAGIYRIATNGSGILGTIVGGVFQADMFLFPNDAGNVATQYKCLINAANGVVLYSFTASVPSGSSALSWSQFRLSGAPLTPAEINALTTYMTATDARLAALEAIPPGSGGAAWGAITGNIANQTDLQNALGGKEGSITAGTTSQYWRGDKSWRDFAADVRAAVLTGLSTATNAVITAADSVLSAFGKLQKQISDNLTTQAAADAAVLASANAYSDGLVMGLIDDRGNFNASVNAYPSSGGSGAAGAILKGDLWTVSVAGSLPSGGVVEPGDLVRALVDAPGDVPSNWAITENNIGYVAENSANKSTNLAADQGSDTKYPSVKAVATAQAAADAAVLNSAAAYADGLVVGLRASAEWAGTGSGGFVRKINPVLEAPNIGAATATSLGVGTTSPEAGLHTKSVNSSTALIIESTSVAANAIWGFGLLHLKNTSAQGPFLDYWSALSRWAFGISSSGSFQMRPTTDSSDPVYGTAVFTILTTGKVGIGAGMTAPTVTLDVSGSVKVAAGTISLPQYTTGTEPAYGKGLTYFNTTLNKLRVGGATAWETVTSV